MIIPKVRIMEEETIEKVREQISGKIHDEVCRISWIKVYCQVAEKICAPVADLVSDEVKRQVHSSIIEQIEEEEENES
jgi:hypothetical protein